MRALPLLILLMTTPPAFAQDTPTPPPPPPATPAPCAAAEHRQFDFWLGEWEVTNPRGDVVGHSRIESILGGCVIAEHWSSARSAQGDGKSYNMYNAELGAWEQFWVDASGSRLVLQGAYAKGAMVLQGAHKPDATTGIAQRERITWTANADGSVRQLWETSKDEGKSWSVSFDGLYRHPAPK